MELSIYYWFSKVFQNWIVVTGELDTHHYNTLDGLLVDYPMARPL